MTQKSYLLLPPLGLLLLTFLVGQFWIGPNSSAQAKGKRKAQKPTIVQDLIPKGKYGRTDARRLKPTYITVHSTQNYAAGTGAKRHASVLKRGSLKSTYNRIGYLSWHFSVDDHAIYQSIPLNEQGQHADYEGPGNRHSIGIEMCENKDGSRQQTVERTAKLIAWLMDEYNIPLKNVVPHYHWERVRYKDGKNVGHKACPKFLMEADGKPGKKWNDFLQLVSRS